MRRFFFSIMLCVAATYGLAQTKAELKDWQRHGPWRELGTGFKPHKTVDMAEFYRQYKKAPEQWQTLFRWLATTDLQAIPKGKHPIPGSNLVASVEDSENQILEKRQSESHRRKADFQLVVSGTEGFALIDHQTSVPNGPYDDKRDVVHYDYQKAAANFFQIDGKQKRFAIFFPNDWHIAKVQTGKKDQRLRVIVVKMDYQQ